MPRTAREQILHIGVDVGGTFTDLVAWDGQSLHIVKIPSTPPEFHRAVIEAVNRVRSTGRKIKIVHGSTVATNALLQRQGEPVAFITTEGFRDMLLIGRQDRPKLYALRVERPKPVVLEENWFTVRERIDARGQVIEPLESDEIDRVIGQIKSRGLRHTAVCLLFSFINPSHERALGSGLQAAGVSASLSCDVLPEFREYERASTTAINAALRPTVQQYLESLEAGLVEAPNLRIMHSGGGTMRAAEAAKLAARLVLSGPAGGVIGAAFVAQRAGFDNIISYDMGGTSTDVATVINGQPQWTTRTRIDGLPIGLPMFEIETIGAGGGSIAHVDAGGALRVGPQSAGAIPGPACYGHGGSQPTVTDANVVLGRIVPENFLGGAMKLDLDAANRAIETLAQKIGKNRIESARGIVRVIEANMAHAVRAVTSRRGRDPRQFVLVSFGGAGGLHACGLADALEIPQVLVPPFCGVLSALGMIVAPPIVDASQTILDRSDRLNDQVLGDMLSELRQRARASAVESDDDTVEYFADVRFVGQSHELTVPVQELSLNSIVSNFLDAYRIQYGHVPSERTPQIVSLRVRLRGPRRELNLPSLAPVATRQPSSVSLIDASGASQHCAALTRAELLEQPATPGPVLIVDGEATTWVPLGWICSARPDGSILLRRNL